MHIYCNQFSLPTLAKREALFQDGVWKKIFSCAHVVFLSLLLLGVNKNNLSLEKKKKSSCTAKHYKLECRFFFSPLDKIDFFFFFISIFKVVSFASGVS